MTAPFRTNDRLVWCDRPEHGSVVVNHVAPHPRSGWIVFYRADHGVTGCAPDTRFALAPPDYMPPPPPPMTEGSRYGKPAAVIDSARFAQWRDDYQNWERKHG